MKENGQIVDVFQEIILKCVILEKCIQLEAGGVKKMVK
jgi:hypothetical protein